MLNRVLTFCASLLMLLGSHVAMAQADLTQVIEFIRQEKYDEAESILNGYLGEKQKNADEIYYWLGYIRIQQEAYVQAQTFFQRGLDEKAKSPLNHAGMGRLALIEDRLFDAREALDKAMDYSKGKDPEVAYAVAEALLIGGPDERGKAKQILYDLRDKYPDDPRPSIYLGEYYKKQGVRELAIEELEKAITKDPSYVPAYAYLAELYYEQGQETGSSDDFRTGLENANKAIELNPDYAPAYRVRGELMLLAKEYKQARNDYEKYVSLTDGDLKAQIRFASFLFLTEEYQECLDRLNAIDTTTNVMRRIRGMSLNKLGRREEAKSAMDDYFANVKKEEYIIWQDYEVYGNILREMGDLDAADEYYQKMILKNPERASVFQDLAEAYNMDARRLEKQASDMKKARIEALKEAQAATDQYNALRDTLPDEAKVQFDIREAKLAEAEKLEAEAIEAEAAALRLYPLEAHYRQKALDYAEPIGLSHYYDLAKAQYNAEMWEEADKNFQEVHGLKADYLPPYSYRLRIANFMENADTTGMDWFVLKPAQDIVDVWGGMDPNTIGNSEKGALLIAYEILANYYFNPTGEDGNYHCEEAKPYLEKIFALDPNYSRVNQLADYCEVSAGRK
ncbi:MAG: hypothetical protein D6722_00415 [Bacteroidetes bacterium]|nr:MAG: hypothetical protein D6722_00415 [Bacteroidota bacterium]